MNDQTITQLKGGAAGLLGVLLVALNTKLGLGLDAYAQGLIASMVLGYYAFLGHQTASANKLAANAPDSPAEPAKVLTLDPKAVADAVTAALTKTAAPVLLAVLAGILLLAPAQASAQALTVGPSIPAFAISPGTAHPAQIAAGAGFTVGADFFPTTLLNQKAHWLTVGLDFYGSLASADKGIGGNAVVALHACLLGLFCVGPGMKLLDSGGFGALDGKLDHRSFLVMIEPDCRVMKLLWPLFAGAPPAPAPVDKPIDGDHPNGV